MNIFRFSLIQLFLAGFAFNCSDDSGTNPTAKNDFRFPLTIGNTWTYDTKREDIMITPAGDSTTLYSMTGTVQWTVIAREEVFSKDTFEIEYTAHYTSGPDSGETAYDYAWFIDQGDTLRGVSYDSMLNIEPISAQLYKLNPSAKILGGTPAEWEWNVNVLVYPLSVGKSWIFGEDEPYRTITIDAYEPISIPAGTFGAYRLERSLHWDVQRITADFTITNWVSKYGYAKTVFRGHSYFKTEDDYNDDITIPAGSTLIHYEEAVLTGYQLQ